MRLSIVLFGNTNNYQYLLAEGFRALGHDVRLILNRKELLHRPESLNPSWIDRYPDWVTDCSDLTEFDIAYNSYGIEDTITRLTSEADFAVLNDIGPALASFLRCPYAAVLTGSDLTYYADFRSLDLRTATWDPAFRRTPQARHLVAKLTGLVARQRDGILMSSLVSYGAKGLIPEGDALLESIGVTDSQRAMIYLSDTLTRSEHPMPNNGELRIFCGSRVVWKQNAAKSYSAIDLKGTDVLIDGFALYCDGGGRGTLHLPKKGSDMPDAMARIDELRITSRVQWYDDMPLSRFEAELISADLICDQFGSSFPGLVTTHAYALGRPVLANFRRGVMPFDLPGLNAETATDVRDALFFAERNRAELARLGRDSRRYAENHLSPKVMARSILKRSGRAISEHRSRRSRIMAAWHSLKAI
jgi:hypothetical protein